MTKRERLLKAFNFERTDRVPILDWVQHGPLAAKMSGRASRDDFWTAEESGMIADRYFDMCQGINASFPQTQDQTRDMEVIEDGEETWYITETSDGFKRKLNYWMGSFMERPFDDLDSVVAFAKSKIEEIEKNSGETDWEGTKKWYRQWINGWKQLANGTDMLLMTPSGGIGLDSLYVRLGWEHLCTLMFDKPDVLSALINAQASSAYTWVENVVEDEELQPVALIHCDVASTTGLLISPEWLRDHIYAHIGRLASFYRDKGIRVLYHSEGNITRIIDDLITLGVEGINPLEKTVPGMSVP